MVDKLLFVALSIDASKLERKMLSSLRYQYSDEVLENYEFLVVCQGFEEEVVDKFRNDYPFVEFIECSRLQGSISYIRKTLMNRFDIFNRSEYVVLIDDDFVFGPKALEQYISYQVDMNNDHTIGMIACHRRMSKEKRLQISTVELPYPQDLAVISMRTGLILRTSAFDNNADEIFDDEILYHEEFYIALKIFCKGFKIGKGWIDVYHQSRQGGLGNSLQKKYDIFTSNESMSAKRVAHEEGLFDINEGDIFYGAQNVGWISKLAYDLHNTSGPNSESDSSITRKD